jgi:D-alanine-D-alanine ligase
LKVILLYNEPTLAADDPDAASEAGVLESVEAVVASLEQGNHSAIPVGLPSAPALAAEVVLRLEPADVVFNLFEGFGGVGHGEAEVAGLVELCGHALTGSPPECLSLVRNKARTKWLLTGAGVPTPEFQLVSADQEAGRVALQTLLDRGPVIVKPAHEDASLGIGAESVVETFERLEEQLAIVHARYGAALVEQFIVGREFNAAVLALPEPEVLPLSEIEFGPAFAPNRQVVTYAAKWASESEACLQTPVRCPAEVAPELAAEIRGVALAAFRLTGCRDYARVDMRVDELGRVFVLEINGNPDISPTAGFARALGAAGIGYDRFIDRLVRNAQLRHHRS